MQAEVFVQPTLEFNGLGTPAQYSTSQTITQVVPAVAVASPVRSRRIAADNAQDPALLVKLRHIQAQLASYRSLIQAG